MSQFKESEHDPASRSPQVPRWSECRCARAEHGECVCEDDGTVTHGGVYAEGFDHGSYRGGDRVVAAARPGQRQRTGQRTQRRASAHRLLQVRAAAPGRPSARGAAAAPHGGRYTS